MEVEKINDRNKDLLRDFKIDINFDYIIHIADIHIPNKTDRKEEYEQIFENLKIELVKDKSIKKKNIAIVIAGDIFDKARADGMLSPNAISLFKNNLINNLRDFGPIIIIPGNHDNNITYQSDYDNTKIDSLKSIINNIKGENKEIFYISETGRFKLGNLILYHISVFDIDKIDKPGEYSERLKILNRISRLNGKEYEEKKHVGLIHCGIENNKIQNGYVLKDCAYKISDLDYLDIVCLGDTHEHQFLGEKKNLGFPSSLIQQNFGESLNNHGLIKWDLDKKRGEFIDIRNDYGYVLINDEDDINSIKFPKKSRIKFKYSYDKEINIENKKEEIKKKTEIISWKENRYSQEINKEDQKNIDNDLNDNEKLLEYIKSKYPDNEEKSLILYDKLIKDITKYKTDIGRLSCEITKIEIEDFQCYIGKHCIDFSNFKKNSTISLNGGNATGKSTWIRALDFVIWGAIKGKKEAYFNNTNKKKKCKCILEFNYDERKYRLTRELFSKGSSKHDCKLEKLNDEENKWCNLSDKYKQNTQNDINRFFGTREDANETWLRQQDSNSSFINSNTNFKTFQHFIGADIFINIFEDTNNNYKKKLNELKIQNAKKSSINIDTLEKDYEEILDDLNKKKEHKDNQLIKIRNKIKKENKKIEYGTNEQKNIWEEKYKLLKDEINELKEEINDKSKEEQEKDLKEINKKLNILVKDKEELLKKIPVKPEKIEEKIEEIIYEIELINNELLEFEFIKLQMMLIMNKDEESIKIALDEEKNKDSTLKDLLKNKDYDKAKKYANQKIELLSNNIYKIEHDYKIEGEKEQIYKNLNTQLQEIKLEQSNIDIDIEDYNLKKKLLIEKRDTYIKINTKKDNYSNKESLEDLEFKKKNVKKEISEKLIEISKLEEDEKKKEEQIIEVPDIKIIEKGKKKLIDIKEKLDEEFKKKQNLDNELKYIKTELNKYNELKFNKQCECCKNNKNHFKINETEDILDEVKISIDKNLNSINLLECKREKYNKYENYENIYNDNLKYKKDIELLKTKLENKKNQLEKCNKDLEDIKESIKLLKENLLLLNEITQLNESIINLELEIEDYEILKEKKDKLESEINIISDKIKYNNYNYENKNKLGKKLEKYKMVQILFEKKKNLELKKENIKLQNLYNEINLNIEKLIKEIELKQQEKEKLEKSYNNDIEIKSKITEKERYLHEIEIKINNYNEKGGYDEEYIKNLEIEQYNIDIEKQDLIKLIGKTESDSNIYNEKMNNLKEINSIIIAKEDEIILLKDYQKIVDPRYGYPNELIKSNLKIYTDRVNQFIYSAGFNYSIEINTPDFDIDSKKNSHKMIFIYKKNNKEFSELSGAENFILNIATLSVLGTILNTTTPPLLVIDEGFSCLDKNHIEELPSMLNFIKRKFYYVLYISHDEFIKSKSDFNIKVTKNENRSFIT